MLLNLSFLPPVQLLPSKGRVGDVAPDLDSRGSVRHRQHLQLPQTHLPLHSQLPPRAPADLTGKDAAGHPQISLHLLSGENSSVRLCPFSHFLPLSSSVFANCVTDNAALLVSFTGGQRTLQGYFIPF